MGVATPKPMTFSSAWAALPRPAPRALAACLHREEGWPAHAARELLTRMVSCWALPRLQGLAPAVVSSVQGSQPWPAVAGWDVFWTAGAELAVACAETEHCTQSGQCSPCYR